jgi:hypothetical protein
MLTRRVDGTAGGLQGHRTGAGGFEEDLVATASFGVVEGGVGAAEHKFHGVVSA